MIETKSMIQEAQRIPNRDKTKYPHLNISYSNWRKSKTRRKSWKMLGLGGTPTSLTEEQSKNYIGNLLRNHTNENNIELKLKYFCFCFHLLEGPQLYPFVPFHLCFLKIFNSFSWVSCWIKCIAMFMGGCEYF